jgi:hypothetical protein
MLIRILAGASLASLTLIAWGVFVGPSRLTIRSERIHFPTVSGFSLDRKELEFPRDFACDLALLFVPFKQYHQATVNTWIPFAQELETARPDVVYYELPTVDERNVLSRTFIIEGMRAGIPDQTARERTVTLYIDTAAFRQATAIPGMDEVHILLVNRDGDIVWRTTGSFDDAKGAGLKQALEAARSQS